MIIATENVLGLQQIFSDDMIIMGSIAGGLVSAADSRGSARIRAESARIRRSPRTVRQKFFFADSGGLRRTSGGCPADSGGFRRTPLESARSPPRTGGLVRQNKVREGPPKILADLVRRGLVRGGRVRGGLIFGGLSSPRTCVRRGLSPRTTFAAYEYDVFTYDVINELRFIFVI